MVLHLLQRHECTHHNGKYRQTSLGHLLIDFFRYYGREFNYQKYGISVRQGQPPLFDKYERGGDFTPRTDAKARNLSLESPLAPEMDIGGKAYNMKTIKLVQDHAHY